MADNERVYVSPSEAKAMLADGDSVHCFLNPGGILLGADWSREDVHAYLDAAETIELAGEPATAMKHGLVARQPRDDWHFFATRPPPHSPQPPTRGVHE